MASVKRPKANSLQGSSVKLQPTKSPQKASSIVIQGSSPRLQGTPMQIQGSGTPPYTLPQVPGVTKEEETPPTPPVYDPAAAAKAADDAKRGKLRGQANGYLDELMNLYNELKGLVGKTGKDNTERIWQNYAGKRTQQEELMNEGMYQTDAGNAASNLAGSSWMSFDRTKVRKGKEANVKVLDDSEDTDLATIGKMVSEDTAKYQADQDGIARTQQLLGETEDIGELTSTVNNLDGTVRGAQAAKGKYGTQGEFMQKANALGNYDTAELDKSLTAIVSNASASPQNRQAAVNDLLNGTPLDEKRKQEYKNKYSQVV